MEEKALRTMEFFGIEACPNARLGGNLAHPGSYARAKLRAFATAFDGGHPLS
jgi:hypothetical protein